MGCELKLSSKLKAIIFDLNGVFIESDLLLSDRFREDFNVYEDKFLPVLKEIMGVVRKPEAPKVYGLFKPYLDSWGVNLSEEQFLDYWFSAEKLSFELLDYAKQLKEDGIKVYTLSNNFLERTNFYRENFQELFQVVDKAYFSAESGYVKPDEMAWKNILTENSLSPEECLYFDDSKKNITVANSLSINAHHYEGLEQVKEIVKDF